jgi:hypothetical protein
MIHILLLAATTAAAAQAPAFHLQVSSFAALALREAPNDYAPFVTDVKGARINASAIAPAFATCGALPTEESGFPILMVCTSEYLPAATAAALYNEGAAALTKSLPRTAIQSGEPMSGTWLVGNQKFSFFAFEAPNRPDLRALFLSSMSSRHLARSPLAESVKAMITRGLRALPDFDGLKSADTDGKFFGVKQDFGAALPQCRIDAKLSSLECLTPGYADAPDAVFSAAKSAVTSALPAGFSAADCTMPRYCVWRGPSKQLIGLMTGADHAGSYGVTIKIAEAL